MPFGPYSTIVEVDAGREPCVNRKCMRSVAAYVLGWFLCLLVVGSLVACGATTPSGQRPDEATHGVPMKDGVPLGDCVDVDTATQESHGCPGFEPAPESPCAEPGKTCRYIRIEVGATNQLTYTCSGDQPGWGQPSYAFCAETCGTVEANTIELSSSSCTRLAPTMCDADWPTIPPPPNASVLAWEMLNKAFVACDAIGDGNTVELAVTDGCPTHLSSVSPLHPNAVACLKQRLSGVRWECATELPCVRLSWDMI